MASGFLEGLTSFMRVIPPLFLNKNSIAQPKVPEQQIEEKFLENSHFLNKQAQEKGERLLSLSLLKRYCYLVGNALLHTSITFTLVTRPSGLKVLSVLASR